MSWPRESLLLAILALSAPWACADSITVNTTTDDFQANQLCSLREAVEYFNRGGPVAGFQGCKSETFDRSAIITLPANASPYLIQGSSITIGFSVSIEGEGRKDDTVTTLQVVGAHRAFIVNHNPRFKPPACAQGTSVTCASDPVRFDLAAASDNGALGNDYLTTVQFPVVEGLLPGIVLVPPATLAPHSYLVRVYANPEEGDPVEVGRTEVAFSTADMPWQAGLILSADRVHHLTYTLQEIDTLSNAPIADEGDPLGHTLKVAVYPVPERTTVRLTRLVIKGGCTTVTNCAPAANDDTDVNNDPALPGYDPYALSFSNGLTGTADNGGIFFSNEVLVGSPGTELEFAL